jgi:hypothetical protein
MKVFTSLPELGLPLAQPKPWLESAAAKRLVSLPGSLEPMQPFRSAQGRQAVNPEADQG